MAVGGRRLGLALHSCTPGLTRDCQKPPEVRRQGEQL